MGRKCSYVKESGEAGKKIGIKPITKNTPLVTEWRLLFAPLVVYISRLMNIILRQSFDKESDGDFSCKEYQSNYKRNFSFAKTGQIQALTGAKTLTSVMPVQFRFALPAGM